MMEDKVIFNLNEKVSENETVKNIEKKFKIICPKHGDVSDLCMELKYSVGTEKIIHNYCFVCLDELLGNSLERLKSVELE